MKKDVVMNVMITGAAGFIGRNLTAMLRTFQTDQPHPGAKITIQNIDIITRHSTRAQWEKSCKRADFVFHLAGVNRAELDRQYRENEILARNLTENMKRCGNTCPIMFASSTQAELRPEHNAEYGNSKLLAEEILRKYSKETGASVYIYRFPNVFGKWCRPEYNSVIATFCHRIARQQPVINFAPDRCLQLVYIDDLLQEMLCALAGVPHREGEYCVVPVTYSATVQEIEDRIQAYDEMLRNLCFVQNFRDDFDAKLLSTFLSFLPKERLSIVLESHMDERGSFTEMLHKCEFGQVSVNIATPLVIKGKHWHHSKWEVFLVVSGFGRIRLREIDSQNVLETTVSGEHMQAIIIPPGYVHELENISRTEKLVTIIWASESYDPLRPDTYYEEVCL